ARRAAAHPHRSAHRAWRRLDGARRRRAGRGELRPRVPHRGLAQPALHRARAPRHGPDRRARPRHGSADASARAAGHAVGGVVALARARSLLLPLGFILLWQLVGTLEPGFAQALPPPSRVLAAGWRALATRYPLAPIGA